MTCSNCYFERMVVVDETEVGKTYKCYNCKFEEFIFNNSDLTKEEVEEFLRRYK